MHLGRFVTLELADAPSLLTESSLASAQSPGYPLTLTKARFHVVMLLYPSDAAEVAGAPYPTYTLPAAAVLQPSDGDGGGGGGGGGDATALALAPAGATFVGGGGMRHVRLQSVPRDVAPYVEVPPSEPPSACMHGRSRRSPCTARPLSSRGTARVPRRST